jgi:hypothetical protein
MNQQGRWLSLCDISVHAALAAALHDAVDALPSSVLRMPAAREAGYDMNPGQTREPSVDVLCTLGSAG